MRGRPPAEQQPSLVMEQALRAHGFACIAGLDEAGRGAWAGPLTAAAVILPLENAGLAGLLIGVRDSKIMTARQRTRWAESIRQVALAWAVGEASVDEVDGLGPLRASRLAMTRALNGLRLQPVHLLIDHLCLPEVTLPQTALPHGDALVLSIAAASVLAKVSRDQEMVSLDCAFPDYGFGRHKGYGTPQHRHALQRLGPSAVHRRSYAPVAALASAGG
ncbi:MAG: ribonuclease HII [Chloroflexi bacterium RBG_13_68_17]|jgi:ribonuclease HII|nr:MAG: ribonuclease HII [Chloroflexi bacterium RBG_13_68_17]